MSIEDRIKTAYRHFVEGDVENALIQTSIAVDAFSKKKYPGLKVGQRIKTFLRHNTDIIAATGTHGFSNAPRMGFPDGSLESILYKSVRCCLLHEGELSESIRFVKGPAFIVISDRLELNQDFILGLILAIIVDDSSRTLNVEDIGEFTCGARRISIAKLQGNRQQFFETFRMGNKS